jgi:hypothetical protein
VRLWSRSGKMTLRARASAAFARTGYAIGGTAPAVSLMVASEPGRSTLVPFRKAGKKKQDKQEHDRALLDRWQPAPNPAPSPVGAI